MIEASASPETPPTRRQLRRRGNVPVSAPATPVSVFTETTPHKRPARPKPSMGRRILGLGTVIAAPLLFVGVSLPVNIFYPSVELSPAVAGQGSMGGTDSGTQSFTVASSASGQGWRATRILERNLLCRGAQGAVWKSKLLLLHHGEWLDSVAFSQHGPNQFGFWRPGCALSVLLEQPPRP